MDKFRNYLGDIPTDTPVQSTSWQRPQNAWIEPGEDEGWVRWEGPIRPVKVGAAQESLLGDFMQLAESPPETIAGFVRKWGVLGLCRHGLPDTHLPRRSWVDLDLVDAIPCPVYRPIPSTPPREAVKLWRGFSSQAWAIHRAAGLIHTNRRVPDELWERLRDLYPPGLVITTEEYFRLRDIERSQESIEEHEFFLLGLAVQRWLQFGDVGVHVRWDSHKGTIKFGGTGLAGAIALQLALTCTSTGAFYICDGCLVTYIPDRRPTEGKNRYCDECRETGVPNKNRSQKFRDRQAALKQTE